MKTWLLQTRKVQYLYDYICYCEEDPSELIMQPEYEDVYNELMDDLHSSFGYLYDDEPEDTEDWTDDDWDEYYQEQFNNFCDGVSFESEEFNEDDVENYQVLIDER